MASLTVVVVPALATAAVPTFHADITVRPAACPATARVTGPAFSLNNTTGTRVVVAALATGSSFSPGQIDLYIGAVSAVATASRCYPNSAKQSQTMVSVAARATAKTSNPTTITPATAVITRKVQLAKYTAEVSWATFVEGAFTIGTSTLNGADTFAASSFTGTFVFNGPYDNVAKDTIGVSTQRGRSDDLALMQAGSAVFSIKDGVGKYNPNNPSSPLGGGTTTATTYGSGTYGSSYFGQATGVAGDSQIVPGRPMRFTASYGGVTYGRYFGFMRRLQWQPAGRGGVATFEALDLMNRLGRGDFMPVLATLGPTTTGAAIARILDALDWTEPGMRLLDTGDIVPDFYGDGTVTGLSLIEGLLQAERGVFYVTRDGIARYRDRHSRYPRVAVAAIVNKMNRINSGVDEDAIVNHWDVWITDFAGTPTYPVSSAEDAQSRRKYGLRTAELRTPYLSSPSAAIGLAQYLLSRTKNPGTPIWAVEISNRDPDLFTTLLTVDIGDRVTIQEAAGGTVGDYIVESVAENLVLETNSHSASWTVTAATSGQAFVVGSSLLNGGDQLLY